jgi:hemoglobin
MSDQSLYDRVGGVFAIAAVVNHFSDAIVTNPKVGAESPGPKAKNGLSSFEPCHRGHFPRSL